jgi:enterochelin esterase-like enzyme
MPDRQVHQVAVLPGWVTTAADRNGWLEDWRLAAGLLTVAVLLLAGWVVVAVRGHRAGRRPRHPVARRLGLGTLVALVTLTGVGAAANSYAGYVPDVASLSRQVPSLVGARNAGGATVDTTTLAAGSRYGPKLISVTLSDRADRIPAGRTWVYLPQGYSDPANAGRRYPVVYLIHGWISSSYDWFGGGEAAKIAAVMQRNGLIQPMILVAPDASAGTIRDTECLDSTTGGPRIETFLTRTVVTAIDSRFRTLPARVDRAIGGLSAGGYCALNIGLHHQDEYAAIMAMEPFGDPGPSAIRYMLGGNQTLGRANSPTDYVRTLPIHTPQDVFLGAARNDETKDTAQSIADILAGRGENVSLSMATSYGHTWREGRAELPYALDFASKALTPPPPRTVTPVGRARHRETPVPARSLDPPRRSGSGRHGGS